MGNIVETVFDFAAFWGWCLTKIHICRCLSVRVTTPGSLGIILYWEAQAHVAEKRHAWRHTYSSRCLILITR